MHRLLPLLILLAACDEASSSWTDTATDTATDTSLDTPYDPPADTSVPDTATDPIEEEPGPSPVCTRWNADMADAADGEWSGDTSSCDPGDMSSGWRERALKVTNLARWLAGMPPSALSSSNNAALQECALMMNASGSLSHSPPSSWSCYSSAGGGAAGNSNLAMAPAINAIGQYMNDFGNTSTMGHRRWILSHGLDSVGFGSTSRYSCMWVLHWVGGSDPAWIAWPPAGDYPEQASHWAGENWTIQSNSISLSGATASATVDGTPLDIETWDLYGGYGSSSAIAFTVRGSARWNMEAGKTYHIGVTTSPPISYDVTIVDCD